MARFTAQEEDIAKTKAENNELKARINTLQAGTSGGSSTVDTKLLSKPTEFEGKEEDWTRFFSEGEGVPWRHRPQVQRVVEDRGGSRSESQPRRSRSRRRPARRTALLRPHNAPEGSAMDKVELVDANCGLQLWRKLTQEYEPKWKSRHLSRHQAILNFRFPDDVIAGFDQFEKELRQYHAITGEAH